MIFYESVAVPTKDAAGWQTDEKVSFGGKARGLFIHFVSGTGPVEISLTGMAFHGEIGGAGKPTSVKMLGLPASEVWIRSAAGDETVQVWAWGD